MFNKILKIALNVSLPKNKICKSILLHWSAFLVAIGMFLIYIDYIVVGENKKIT